MARVPAPPRPNPPDRPEAAHIPMPFSLRVMILIAALAIFVSVFWGAKLILLHNPDFYWGMLVGLWIGGLTVLACYHITMR